MPVAEPETLTVTVNEPRVPGVSVPSAHVIVPDEPAAGVVQVAPETALKVVFGGVAPGFDDFTNGWSNCATRQLPPVSEATPRDPGVLDGVLDYLGTKSAHGVILQTWDDWTEGTFFEPSVSEGTAKLDQLQADLATLFGETPASGAALHDRWYGYGQARGCGTRASPPAIELGCP